jgi:UDP:flavonoid glycosyltransferase YjiC (YdhE family)
LLLGLRTDRPPIISVSVSPVVLSSVDASPLGPAVTIEEKKRNSKEIAQFQASLAPAQDYLNDLLHGYGSRSLSGFYLDCIYTLPDLILQLSVEALEFPRTDLPEHLKFVGPVLPKSSSSFIPPNWWNKLDGSKPVVLVTQGTVANTDLNELIGPTLAGLSAEDFTVIAATGRPAGALSVPVPPNAIATSYVPFLEILPKVDVFVTNGGYGAVNQALSMGVPLVIAGDSEDKAFVATRVAWTGAGISLGTSRPQPEEIRHAVREVLRDNNYRSRALMLQNEFAEYNALESITWHVESFLWSERNAEAAYEHSNI